MIQKLSSFYNSWQIVVGRLLLTVTYLAECLTDDLELRRPGVASR